MKFFITNKELFDSDFQSIESQKSIHRKGFNILLQGLGKDKTPPKQIRIDHDYFNIEFNFQNVVNDIYFYSYERW